ncbi:hypothetical protein ACJRO7_015578 [Eucalyptus globulus]|uniref:Uncharacterized protein n=1 Tax=Eucalyptus globulus TaxID=34317 RepID=A0ABD3L9I4_EUCGL
MHGTKPPNEIQEEEEEAPHVQEGRGLPFSSCYKATNQFSQGRYVLHQWGVKSNPTKKATLPNYITEGTEPLINFLYDEKVLKKLGVTSDPTKKTTLPNYITKGTNPCP